MCQNYFRKAKLDVAHVISTRSHLETDKKHYIGTKKIRQEQKQTTTDGKFTTWKIVKLTIDNEDGAVALQPNHPLTSTFIKYSN